MIKRPKLTPAQADVIRLARSVIRDRAMDWAERELAESPRKVCERLSDLLGETYDFERGEVKE